MPITNPKDFVDSYLRTSKKGTGTITDPKAFVDNYLNTGGIPRIQTGGLKTSDDLYNLATQSGLQKQADKVLEEKGEEVKKIFSGGFISDVFDALNALQYGVTGVLKGKSFAEGVKTRQSFSDKDALGDEGIPGIIAGIALDIAVDPLTYIAPWTILRKIPGLAKGAKAVSAATKATRAGKWLGRKFVWMSGADPVFRETYERAIGNIAVGGKNVSELVKGITELTPEAAKKLLTRDETGRFIRRPLKELSEELNEVDFQAVKKAWNSLDDLGKQAVDLNLLSKETWEKNMGDYIKNAYLEYEQVKKKSWFGFKKLGIKGIKARKDAFGVTYQPAKFGKKITKKFATKEARESFIKGLVDERFTRAGGKILEKFKPLTPEEMAKLGQIDNPAYLLFKSMFDLTRDVENVKLFRVTAQRFGTDVAQDGFTRISNTAKFGDLAGKYVPDHIATYINEISEPIKYGVGKKLVANFKFFKVVMNPATHARNIMSNQVLNWWKLGMNPLDPRTISSQIEAIGEIARKGGKWIEEAKKAGYGLNTFTHAEINNMLSSPEALTAGKKLGKKWGQITETLGNIYQGEENFAKLSAFIFNRKHKGMGIDEAWKAAESATFNYSQVTPFIRKVRESLFGFPFITFTYKATPTAIETALKHPRRISSLGKIKNGIENLAGTEETAKERANEPAWIRDGFFIKLPIKDKHGRSAYFDLTYIIPFGDIVSGQFFDGRVLRETGMEESKIRALASKSPLINIIKEVGSNEDFYGDKIWKESDTTEKQLGDLMRHLTKAYVPPLVADQLPGGYNKKGERRPGVIPKVMQASPENQKRTLMQEVLRTAGIKLNPINADTQETFMEWEKKKALQNLLREAGILKEFSTFYLPK